MLKAILVDMDGTLIDTERANALAYCQALAEHGTTVSVDEFSAISRGRSYKEFLPEILGPNCLELIDPIALRKRALYRTFFGETEPNWLLVDLLRNMHASTKIALVTTASRQATTELLAHHGLDEMFDAVVTGDDVTEGKPSPEPYATAARQFGVTAGECLVFEDSETGVTSAQAFGALVLARV
ncbi:hypothetical protein DAMDJJ_14730 [Cupriavidus necator]|uniref:HAD family hydrolase n=1 Tax=Cupriavidus necator TaxID=106590 RepID=UPI003F73A41F